MILTHLEACSNDTLAPQGSATSTALPSYLITTHTSSTVPLGVEIPDWLALSTGTTGDTMYDAAWASLKSNNDTAATTTCTATAGSHTIGMGIAQLTRDGECSRRVLARLRGWSGGDPTLVRSTWCNSDDWLAESKLACGGSVRAV